MANEPRVFVLGGNGSTLAVANSLRTSGETPRSGTIEAKLVPLAFTPLGAVIGDTWQNVGLSASGLFEWIDRAFPPEDERAFIAPARDVELLVRIGWSAPLPERLDETSVLNPDDLPEDLADALAQPPAAIVQCGACRRLCVRDEFVWKEKQLCAWDYHAQVFGKRGPWRNGPYEERHFETLAACAYVAPPLLPELGVETVAVFNALDETVARETINVVLAASPQRAHLAVRTEGGFTLLRETDS